MSSRHVKEAPITTGQYVRDQFLRDRKTYILDMYEQQSQCKSENHTSKDDNQALQSSPTDDTSSQLPEEDKSDIDDKMQNVPELIYGKTENNMQNKHQHKIQSSRI